MERLTKTLLLGALLLAPINAPGAEVKAFKHQVSVYHDEKEAGLKNPGGIACDDKLQFTIADTGNGRFVRYALQDEKLKGGGEFKVPELPFPDRVQLNSKGELFALDVKLRRIGKLSAAGAFAGYLTPRGVPAPEKVVPRSFKIDQADNLYLLDLAGNRVLVLDPAGNFKRQIPFPQGGYYADLAVGPAGQIFLIDPTNAALLVAAKDATSFTPLVKDLASYAAFPTYLTTDSRGLLYVVDEHGNAIVTLTLDGAFVGRRLVMGWKDGQLNYPGQICLANDGTTLFVTDRENSKVQIFQILR